MEHRVELPFSDIGTYKAGDILYLTGEMYTARDAAHKRMYESICALRDKEAPEDEIRSALPFDLRGATVYYLGPTDAAPGQVIGSAGPTTSGRMDKYTPTLLDLGLTGMIGKGRRSEEVKEAISRNKAIYLGATGGAGALLSKCIRRCEIIAYEDLGTEAVRRLYVENFPVTVLIDSEGCVFKP